MMDKIDAALAEQPAHTDHPLRHWDRTCPACIAEQPAQTEAVKDSLTPQTPAGKDAGAVVEPVAWREFARTVIRGMRPEDYGKFTAFHRRISDIAQTLLDADAVRSGADDRRKT